jgi:hypothetical protein
MINLRNHKHHILNIKNKVNSLDNSLFSHDLIENHQVTENTISIVMTASNRSKQTYFTLKTLAKSSFKDIQVIIVDDSSEDPINLDILKTYPFYIDLININKTNKDWHNPLVNYNIGFKFIKGSKVIIQNAEVCHIGDVLNFIHENVKDDNYYVFDVKASLNYDTNESIYNFPLDYLNNGDVYTKNELFCMWYQHISHNRNYHFLTALTKNTFNMVSEFSYDCTMGVSYDDNDLLLKIISKRINIINIFNEVYNIGGIHLFHCNAYEKWDHGRPSNDELFNNKNRVFGQSGEYIDVTFDYDKFDENFQKLQ